jgi:hypothetical protein
LLDEGNYSFKGEVKDRPTNIDIIDVEKEGKTVILTLEQAVDNQRTGTLVIDEEVMEEELSFKDIEFLDKVIPTVKKRGSDREMLSKFSSVNRWSFQGK